MASWSNWSGRVRSEPQHLRQPQSREKIESLVRKAQRENKTVRVAGAGHSFSELVPTDDLIVSLDRFTGPITIDGENHKATVRAGTPLSQLGEILWSHGLAMENLGDIDHQSIGGAISTGTHGTGIDYGVLSTQVSKLKIMTPDRGWVECSPDQNPKLFRAAQVSLGALGIIAEVTLDLEPAYYLQETVRSTSIHDCLNNLEELRENNRHFEFFWFPGTDTVRIKTLNKTDERTNNARSPLRSFTENTLFEGLCRAGTWFPSTTPLLKRLAAQGSGQHESTGPAPDVFASHRGVRFNEMEYGVPADRGPEAFRRILRWINDYHPEVQFPVEYRYVQGDDIPLSPAYGDDRAFIALHKYYKKSHEDFLREAEHRFEDYEGRPHWGKIHYRTTKELKELYPEWETFQAARQKLDPTGIFLNDYLRSILNGT